MNAPEQIREEMRRRFVGEPLYDIAIARDALNELLAAGVDHVGPPYGSNADLAAELEARRMLDLLDAQLGKPALGNPRFALGRARARVHSLDSSLHVARLRLADLEQRDADA